MENENKKSVIRFVGESNQRVIDSRDVAWSMRSSRTRGNG